jgi:hypothetical protein
VDRYHQVIEPVPDGPVRDGLEVVGARLAALLDAVHERCVAAQAAAPSSSFEVPGGPDGAAPELHRRISRAAALAAQAAEAAAMARVALRTGSAGDAAQHVAAADRAVTAASSLLDR